MKEANSKTSMRDQENLMVQSLTQFSEAQNTEQYSNAITKDIETEIQKNFDQIKDDLEKEGTANHAYREKIKEAHSRLFEEWNASRFIPHDNRKEVPIDSLEAFVGYTSLVRLLHDGYTRSIAFYRRDSQAYLTPDEARERAFHRAPNLEKAGELFNEIMSYPLHQISLHDLHQLHGYAPRVAEYLWEDIKAEGRADFESGHLAAQSMLPAEYMKQVWDVARYLGVRESFIEEWQPRGGIEISLIDMLAQTFFQFQYWMEQVILRSQTKPREEHPKYKEWKRRQTEMHGADSWREGYWFPPYVYEQEAIDHAAKMADRFNRIYLRTLRQLRDLRRYSQPLTINNPNQVNIATDRGQQINLNND